MSEFGNNFKEVHLTTPHEQSADKFNILTIPTMISFYSFIFLISIWISHGHRLVAKREHFFVLEQISLKDSIVLSIFCLFTKFTTKRYIRNNGDRKKRNTKNRLADPEIHIKIPKD